MPLLCAKREMRSRNLIWRRRREEDKSVVWWERYVLLSPFTIILSLNWTWMTTLREKNNTSDHHRAWQAFFQKMKNLHVLFSFEQQGFTKKKLTERQTHLHKNIIILLVLIKNILKKCVNKNDFIDCSEKQNWKKAKIKNKEKKKSSSWKCVSFWYYVHHYYVSCQS